MDPVNIKREEIETIAETLHHWSFNRDHSIHLLKGKVFYCGIDESNSPYSLEVNSINDWNITLNYYAGYELDRLTLAHELGHYVLHSDFGKFPGKYPRYGNSLLEHQANWFSWAFLMPKDKVLKAFKEADEKYKKIDDVVKYCAIKLQVSNKVMAKKLSYLFDLDIIKES
jgi:Zn-dependent peptidase ImmA (M78 family)